jgi:hypothetical protein
MNGTFRVSAKERRARAREKKAQYNERRRRERIRMAWAAEMCSSCAYRPGTEASREEGDPGLTAARKAMLVASQPFYCHEDPPTGAGPERKLCVGHAAHLTAQYLTGYVPPADANEKAAEALRNLKCQRGIACMDTALEALEGGQHAT